MGSGATVVVTGTGATVVVVVAAGALVVLGGKVAATSAPDSLPHAVNSADTARTAAAARRLSTMKFPDPALADLFRSATLPAHRDKRCGGGVRCGSNGG